MGKHANRNKNYDRPVNLRGDVHYRLKMAARRRGILVSRLATIIVHEALDKGFLDQLPLFQEKEATC